MTDHFAMVWALGLFMGMGLMKLARERETQDDPRRRFNHENRRGPVGPPPLKLRRSGDPDAIRPTTPKPAIVPTPQGPAMRRVYYNPSTIAECGGPCMSSGPEAGDCGALWLDEPIKPQFPLPRPIREDFLP